MELKHGKSSSLILIFCISMMLVTPFGFTVGDDHHGYQREPYRMKEQDREVAAVKPSFWEMLKNGFFLYTSSPLRVTSYLEKVKALAHQAHAYFVPPNLDFRRSTSDEAGDDQLSSGGGGAGEKVKMAMSKSLGKSKATVEDSAKSAAKMVGETVQKTKEKVKKSLSEREAEPHKPEL